VPGSTWENYRVHAGGVSCYSSIDLLNWKYEGIALATNTANPAHDLHTSKVIERPKVIFNKKTGKFIMWMHIDAADYLYARSGVAVSDLPTGPFVYKGSERPNGNMARDMTIFQDDDGKAWHFYSSEDNATMHICLLSDDYLSNTPLEKRILIGQSREAPAVCKAGGRYNPCTGPGADQTYLSKSTYILPLPGEKSGFIFMADKWNKKNLEDSRYVWLPLTITGEGTPEITWKDSWTLP